MSVILIKPNQSSTTISTPPISPATDIDELRRQVGVHVFDCYCDVQTRGELIRIGVANSGLTAEIAEVIVDMELEVIGAANEKKLLLELEAVLHQFTDKDKKLDPKERNDALQLVGKARAGYRKGLQYDVADSYIVNFCRANGVKVKIGLLRWTIP